MRKKIITLCLAMVLSVGLLATAAAASYAEDNDANKTVSTMGWKAPHKPAIT